MKPKILNLTLNALLIGALSMNLMACKKDKSNEATETHQTSHDDHSNHGHDHGHKEVKANTNLDAGSTMHQQPIVTNYMALKNALVKDDIETAQKAAKSLLEGIDKFDKSKYEASATELKEILEDAKMHCEHIVKSDMHHSREHFKTLSKDIKDLIKIIGTDKTVFVQYCPMAFNNKGAEWLSLDKNVLNPYFGSSMLRCGKVTAELK